MVPYLYYTIVSILWCSLFPFVCEETINRMCVQMWLRYLHVSVIKSKKCVEILSLPGYGYPKCAPQLQLYLLKILVDVSPLLWNASSVLADWLDVPGKLCGVTNTLRAAETSCGFLLRRGMSGLHSKWFCDISQQRTWSFQFNIKSFL